MYLKYNLVILVLLVILFISLLILFSIFGDENEYYRRISDEELKKIKEEEEKRYKEEQEKIKEEQEKANKVKDIIKDYNAEKDPYKTGLRMSYDYAVKGATEVGKQIGNLFSDDVTHTTRIETVTSESEKRRQERKEQRRNQGGHGTPEELADQLGD